MSECNTSLNLSDVGLTSSDVSCLLAQLQRSRDDNTRRLFSQRQLGIGKPIDGQPFTTRSSLLDDDDAMLLMSLSNANLFAHVVRAIVSHRDTVKQETSTAVTTSSSPLSSPGPSMESIIHEANPLFLRFCSAPLISGEGADVLCGGELGHVECVAVRRCMDAVRPRRRERSRRVRMADPLPNDAVAESTRTNAKRTRLDKKEFHDAAGEPSRAHAGAVSASAGLVAQSMRSWGDHLERVLKQEGETVRTFRAERSNTSHLDKQRFEEEARWREYRRELELQELQREQARRRDIRRGVTDT